jgi:hypothetical protein
LYNMLAPKLENTMNNRIKMTDSKFKCNIFLFLGVTVFMARLSIFGHASDDRPS